MTEEQLLAFLSVHETVEGQLRQLLALGGHLRFDQKEQEIVVMGPRIGLPAGTLMELARVPFKPEAMLEERQYAARLLVIDANRAFLGRRPMLALPQPEK